MWDGVTGGLISLDGIWWKAEDTKVKGFQWNEINTICYVESLWFGNHFEINGEKVYMYPLVNSIGLDNCIRFLSAISGCQIGRK